jgi:hypothetical protein
MSSKPFLMSIFTARKTDQAESLLQSMSESCRENLLRLRPDANSYRLVLDVWLAASQGIKADCVKDTYTAC